MLKKLLALLLVFCMLFSVATLLAACDDDGGKKKSSSSRDDDEDEDEEEDEDKDEDEDKEGEDKENEEDEEKDGEDEEDKDPEGEETQDPEGEIEPGTEPVTKPSQNFEQEFVGNFAIPSEGYDGSPVTITFAHTMGHNLQGVLDTYIQEFNELYPNITIVHGSYGGWSDISDIISEEIIGGDQPNIAYCYPDHVAMYNRAWATVTLDDLINCGIEVVRADGSTELLGLTNQQVKDFIPGFFQEGAVYDDGLMYTLPLSKSTEVLYYNKTFFEANDLEVPTTWEEMEALCRQIKEIDPNAIPLGYDSEDNLFITMCAQYGFDYTSAGGDEHIYFNNDGCKAFVKAFRSLYQDGLMTTESLYGAYTSSLFIELDKSALHSYMCIGSSGGASYQIPDNGAFEVGVAPIPQADPSMPRTMCQGPSLCILKGGDTTDQQILASWLFVKFLTTNMEFQAEFSMASGYLPVLQSVYLNDTYANWLRSGDGYRNLKAKVIEVCLTNAESYFTAPAFVGSAYVRQRVGELVSDCLSSTTSNPDSYIDDAFDKAYQDCLKKCG